MGHYIHWTQGPGIWGPGTWRPGDPNWHARVTQVHTGLCL